MKTVRRGPGGIREQASALLRVAADSPQAAAAAVAAGSYLRDCLRKRDLGVSPEKSRYL